MLKLSKGAPAPFLISGRFSAVLQFFGLFAIAVCWSVPGHYPPWLTFQQEVAAAFGVALLAGSALLRGEGPNRWPPIALAAGALAFVPVLQWATGLLYFHSDALLPALFLVAFALCMAMGSSMSTQALDGLAIALSAGGALCVVLALAQWLGVSQGSLFIADLPPKGRPFGNLAQPNHMSTALMMSAAAVMYLFERQKLHRIGAGALVLLLILGQLLSQSRTGWLSAAAFLALILLLRKRCSLRTTPVAALLLISIYVIGAISWHAVGDALLLNSQTISSRMQLGVRSLALPMMFDASLEKPLLGYGWGQARLAQLAVALDHPPTHYYFNSAHNVLLDLAIWAGWPIAIAVGTAVALWFFRRLKACKDGARLALLLSCLAVWIHAFTEYPLEYGYFLFPLGILMGAADGGSEARSAGPSAFRLLFAATLAAGAVVVAQYVQLEGVVRTQRFISAGIGTDKVSSVERPHTPWLDAQVAIFDFVTASAGRGMSPADLDLMGKAAHRNPFPNMLFRYAFMLGLNGRTHDAERELATACTMQMPRECQAAVEQWTDLQRQYPDLSSVRFPRTDAPKAN